jgi:hypothetical protein
MIHQNCYPFQNPLTQRASVRRGENETPLLVERRLWGMERLLPEIVIEPVSLNRADSTIIDIPHAVEPRSLAKLFDRFHFF